MLELSRTRNSTLPAHLFASCPTSHHSSLVTLHRLIQSLAKHNRKPSQLFETNQQHPKSIASFCRLSCGRKVPKHYIWGHCIASKAQVRTQTLRVTNHEPRITNHYSPITTHHAR